MTSFSDHLRRRPAHLSALESGNRSIIQFVTICTQQRQALLNDTVIHALLIELWQDHSAYQVGRYVLMPDHIHLFCAPNTFPNESLSKWIRYWKSRASTKWPGNRPKKIWQRDFWDRQLRSGDSYTEKWNYVRNNPVRAGLVRCADEWPYQGEISQLSWHH